jgi:hypothetical protein
MTTRTKPATSAEVLEQLRLADAVIMNALPLMNASQKVAWNRANVASGIHPEDGVTGYNARASVLARAMEGQTV